MEDHPGVKSKVFVIIFHRELLIGRNPGQIRKSSAGEKMFVHTINACHTFWAGVITATLAISVTIIWWDKAQQWAKNETKNDSNLLGNAEVYTQVWMRQTAKA